MAKKSSKSAPAAGPLGETNIRKEKKGEGYVLKWDYSGRHYTAEGAFTVSPDGWIRHTYKAHTGELRTVAVQDV